LKEREGNTFSMRILITGSSGQLGTEIARQLSSEHKTIGVDIVAGNYYAFSRKTTYSLTPKQ
jgi:nucleoside-diphosphate-sugar epimerase